PTLGARACLGQRRRDRRRDSNGPPDHCQAPSWATGVESRRPGGAVYLDARADLTALSQGSWDESTAASVPLRVGGRNVGRLDLGRRNNGVGCAPRELEHLQKAADVVAAAISVSHESHTVGAHPLVGSGSKRT